MRCLAVARYRLLTSVRLAGWIFASAIVVALLAAMVAAFSPDLVVTTMDRDIPTLFAVAARALEASYIFHTIILLGACHSFGSRRSRVSSTATADLMDAAPVSPAARYWGDALGIFGSTMTIHAATLPAMALVFALGPLPLPVFLWLEAAVIALVVLESAASSWKLQSSRQNPNTARAAAGVALFSILVLTTVISLTRWREFRDAWAYLMVWPSGRAWSSVVETIDSPALLGVLVAVIYASFLGFYHHRGIRALEHS
jgi:hypothetical protein